MPGAQLSPNLRKSNERLQGAARASLSRPRGGDTAAAPATAGEEAIPARTAPPQARPVTHPPRGPTPPEANQTPDEGTCLEGSA